MFKCEFYHLLNVKSDMDNPYDALEGPLVGTKGQGRELDLPFSQCLAQCQIYRWGLKNSVNGIDPSWSPNNSTWTVLISRKCNE